MLAALPSFINTDNLQGLAMFVIVVLVVLAYIVYRFVKTVVMRVLGLVIIAGLAFAVWSYRDNLEECAKTCSCELFGQEVQLPDASEVVCNQLSILLP